MAARKTSGYRTITVEEQRFKWQFQGVILIFLEELPGRQTLEIDFGWFDRWPYVLDPENMPPEAELNHVTPAFVASAITFALNHGWNPNKRGGKFLLNYKGGTFCPSLIQNLEKAAIKR